MATLAEKLEAMATLDTLERTENPLATANWEKMTGAENIGQCTTTGWTTTETKKKAGAKWKGTLSAGTEFAVLFTAGVIPAEEEQIQALGFFLSSQVDTFMFREGGSSFHCGLEVGGVEKTSAAVTLAAGDRYAVCYHEGKAKFMRKASAGSWEEKLSSVVSLTGTASGPYIEFAPGTKASTTFRAKTFAAGKLEEATAQPILSMVI